MLGKGTGGLGNKRTNEDYPDYSIINIGLTTGKNQRDLRRHPVRRHKLTLG